MPEKKCSEQQWLVTVHTYNNRHRRKEIEALSFNKVNSPSINKVDSPLLSSAVGISIRLSYNAFHTLGGIRASYSSGTHEPQSCVLLL